MKEDQLVKVILSEEGEEALVQISAKLEPTFRAKLVQLLRDYKDMFTWSYADMEGINPRFYEHKINLKLDQASLQCNGNLKTVFYIKIKKRQSKKKWKNKNL